MGSLWQEADRWRSQAPKTPTQTVTSAEQKRGHLLIARDAGCAEAKTWRAKRRRKGQLDNGEWAPGRSRAKPNT